MSAPNPFQIPSCFKLDIEHRRRERFKKSVVTAVIVSVAIVVGLLIEGCVSEKSQAAGEKLQTLATINQKPALASKIPAKPSSAQPNQQPMLQATFPIQHYPVAMAKAATPVEFPHTTGGAVYLVKSGDTLSRIAKKHGTTVKALKFANNLTTDRIVVGEKLKVPAA